jgi:hypothetical protein
MWEGSRNDHARIGFVVVPSPETDRRGQGVMTRKGDTFKLSTGRKFDANCGILGMSDGLSVTEGYDGSVQESNTVKQYEEAPEPFTLSERAEIAAYMIDLWRRWAVLS